MGGHIFSDTVWKLPSCENCLPKTSTQINEWLNTALVRSFLMHLLIIQALYKFRALEPAN